MALEAVIFDFGGVLVRTRDQAPRRRWEQALDLQPGQAEGIVFGAETDYAVQLGRISDADHWHWVQLRLGLSAEDIVRFRRDFFACDWLDRDLLAQIDRLRARYHVGLLSNASSDARRMLAEQYDLLRHFDSVTLSSEEGLMKPDERIYRIALARASVAPDAAIFVDDVPANVAAARAIGMQAVHFADPVQARQELSVLTGIK